MHQLEHYIDFLHKSPVPLIQIESRSLKIAVQHGTLAPSVGESVDEWKKRHGLATYDESEYRYLLRDLGLTADRKLDPTIDVILPLGGDGPSVGEIVHADAKIRMYYLSSIGEMCYALINSDYPAFESSLFWLILRNQIYLPLFQQIILNPLSYTGADLAEVISATDSVSKNCALHWLRYFGIATYVNRYSLQVENLARRLLASAIFEINQSFNRDETYYVKEVDRQLNERFSLNSTTTNFKEALGIIFRYSKKSILGYTSGRGDISLPGFPKISMVKFGGRIPLSVAGEATEGEVLKIMGFSGGRKQ